VGGKIRAVTKKALALINSSHPIPCLAVASFAALFATASGNSWDTSLLIFLVVLLQQISVGQSNDWLDYKRDVMAGRKDKPAVIGTVKVSELRTGAIAAAVLAQATSFIFGPTAALVMFAMLVAGWAYNLGMKLNWTSFIPYAVGFGLIPIFVGQASAGTFWAEAWIVLAASLLGVSAHFANVLPDIEADRLTGVKSLPHILGQKPSAIAIAITALSATVIVVTQSASLDYVWATIGLASNVVIVGLASLLSLRKNPPRSAFLLPILASLVNVVLLMLGSGL
jgi:4-hydroxybenzoate polyprenyltransferase